MAKAIFISSDCWLCVFDLISPRQLGFGIALISHRFNFYVDQHFKTRKRTFKYIQIRSKIEENGTKKMEIINFNGETLPIPQIQLPREVIGFERIESQFILHKIWPLLGKNFRVMELSAAIFHRLRQFVPSILNDCTSRRVISANYAGFFDKLPCDDSATASDGKAVAKWLFTARPDNVPKFLKCSLYTDGNWPLNIEPFKTAFANASSPVNFIVSIWFRYSVDFVVPFDLINELTREQLALKRTDYNHFFCWSVVQLRETKANGQNVKRKRLFGKLMTNGIRFAFIIIVRMKSEIGFSTQFPAQVINRSE